MERLGEACRGPLQTSFCPRAATDNQKYLVLKMSKGSQHSGARLLGGVYLLYFVTAVSSGLFVKDLAVRGDALATAHNRALNGGAVGLGSAIGLVSIGLYLTLSALLYELLRPVSRRVSLLATLLSVAACAIQALADIFLAPLPLLASNHGANGVETAGYLAQACVAMHIQALQFALVLFGGFDILVGYLIFRSGFLPRLLGLLMMLAGLGWFVYLWPPIADKLSQVVQPFGFLAEALLMIWLLAKGVNEERWKALATTSR